MRFRERQAAGERATEDGMLPMINVVFLLLIFFMLSGQLASLDPFEVELPATASNGEPESEDAILVIGRYGRLALDGEEVSLDDLPAAVARRAAATPGLMMRVKADGRTESLLVVGILRTVREAGVESVQLLAQPGPG